MHFTPIIINTTLEQYPTNDLVKELLIVRLSLNKVCVPEINFNANPSEFSGVKICEEHYNLLHENMDKLCSECINMYIKQNFVLRNTFTLSSNPINEYGYMLHLLKQYDSSILMKPLYS